MDKRDLGKTGLRISALGIGSSPFRFLTAASAAKLLCCAVDLGINYYDTARSYANGEEAVAALPHSVRQELLIATKTGARSGRRCVRDLNTSLVTMRRQWIDVWMTHMIETESEYDQCTSLGGFCDIAAGAKRAGLIRASGASFHAPTRVILRAIQEGAFDVVMFQLNLIGRETIFGASIASYREELLPAAQASGIGVVVMKVLAGGELRFGASKLSTILGAPGDLDPIQLSIKYVLCNPAIASAVVGVRSHEELAKNVEAVTTCGTDHVGASASWERMIASATKESLCRRCGNCLDNCPERIQVPKIMRLLEQKCVFGMDVVARHKYRSLSVDATHCTDCRCCEDYCPVGFDISAELKRAHFLLDGEADFFEEAVSNDDLASKPDGR